MRVWQFILLLLFTMSGSVTITLGVKEYFREKTMHEAYKDEAGKIAGERNNVQDKLDKANRLIEDHKKICNAGGFENER